MRQSKLLPANQLSCDSMLEYRAVGLCNPVYAFLSDEYINTIDKVQEPLRNRLTGLIQADKCFSVSYYDDSFNKRRIIVYSYGGQKRAGYFCNGIPISHTENLEQFVTEMLMVNQETDVFIKIA